MVGGKCAARLALLLRMTPASIHASTPWPHHILSPFTLSLTLILICCRVICSSPFLCTPDGAPSSSIEIGSGSLHPTTYPCSDLVPSPLQRLKARSVKYISILEPTLCIGFVDPKRCPLQLLNQPLSPWAFYVGYSLKTELCQRGRCVFMCCFHLPKQRFTSLLQRFDVRSPSNSKTKRDSQATRIVT